MADRYPTKKIYVGSVAVGGDSPVSVQSMTYSKTKDVESTVAQIRTLQFAGCDIARVSVVDEEDALSLSEIKDNVSIPLVADIHFNYRLALIASKSVDCIRINPGNIGSKSRVKEVANACMDNSIPIRIGVNCGSLEKQFEIKYGQTSKGMVESGLYNIKYLEDVGFRDIKISLKASDAPRTIEAYRLLRPKVPYPFHLGVTEAGTIHSSTIKSSIGIGSLLVDGIGDTIRVSITGELEKEVEIGKDILRYSGLLKSGINIISCPTCGRIEVDLVKAVKEIEKRTSNMKAPLNISIMGCAVNALGEAKGADLAIAYGKGGGLVIKKGKILTKLPEKELTEYFLEELNKLAKEYSKKI